MLIAEHHRREPGPRFRILSLLILLMILGPGEWLRAPTLHATLSTLKNRYDVVGRSVGIVKGQKPVYTYTAGKRSGPQSAHDR